MRVRWWLGQYDDDKDRAAGHSVYNDAVPLNAAERALLAVFIVAQVIIWLWMVALLFRL